MYSIIVACIGIFLGELYGNLVGGGSIVTQFVLQTMLAFEIKEAIALDNAAVVGSELGLFLMLLRKEKIKSFYFYYLAATLIGSYFGVLALNYLPVELIKKVFVLVLLAVLVKIIFFNKTKFESKGFSVNTKNIVLLFSFGIFVGAYNAFLSIGDFIIGLIGLIYFFNFKYHNALFLLSFVLVFGRGFAAYKYFNYGLINFNFLIPMFFSSMLSGLIIGSIAHKVKTEKIDTILKIVGVVFACLLVATIF